MNKSAMTIRRIVISGLLLSGVLALQGCIEAVIVGGAASGVLVIADRRQPDVMASDERIIAADAGADDRTAEGPGR